MVERWTPIAPDHIVYIVTIDDPKVYTQPRKLRVDFRRHKLEEQWARPRSRRSSVYDVFLAR